MAQEVFLRICSRIADFDRRRDGLSWAFGIASYEIMTHRRRQQRRREAFEPSALREHVDPAASQEQAIIQRELAAALTAAVGALSEEDRVTLGLVPAPVEAGVQPATARKRRQRALDRLRAIWRNLHGEP